MTDQMTTPIVIVAALLPLVAAVAIQLGRTQAAAHALNRVCAVTAALTGYVAAVLMVVEPSRTTWIMADPVAGIYVAVVSSVALASALISPAYLQHAGESFFAGRRVHSYYFALYAFWSGLVLIPVIANLGMAWLVVESTTAASAVLVAYSGKARALEAGWKYLMLTTLGLSLAFLGIVIMFASAKHGDQLRILNWSDLGGTLGRMPHGAALTAYALVVLGLAAKIGWAPVHNWLPDAHSEAPAPVSAMLSSALLPAVMLLLWRLRDGGDRAARPRGCNYATRGVRTGVGCRCRAFPVAAARVETAAGVLESGTHGNPGAGNRFCQSARPCRSGVARRGSRRVKVARVLRSLAVV